MTIHGELNREFFKGKRRWSIIKDDVLGKYMVPYLAKVKKLGKNILLIDTFAGPGVFEDGSLGSPSLMVQSAEAQVPNQYQAIFVNNDKIHHKSILDLFGENRLLGNLIEQKKVTPLRIDAKKFLIMLNKELADQTLFLYLDPYGLEGCEFNTWLPFLKRKQRASTEIMVNINFNAVRRLASKNAFLRGNLTPQSIKFHKRLDDVFGGDFWKKVLLESNLNQDDAEEELMRLFKKKIMKYIRYVGYCPVKENPKSPIKYYIMFLSNSDDGFLLMNDFMCRAYNKRMDESLTDGLPLFKDLRNDWKKDRDLTELRKIIIDLIKTQPYKSRKKYWKMICVQHFMQYLESEYIGLIKVLYKSRILSFEDVKRTGRLNNTCKLFLS